MPALEPHEELKLAWEVELMSVTIDKTRLDIGKIRADLEDSRRRWDHEMVEAAKRWEKGMHDIKMDEKRFNQAWWTVLIAGLAAITTASLAYLTWWTTHIPH